MDNRIKFTGNFGEYFVMSLGLLVLSVITFGLALPYWIYWSTKYFFTRLEIGGQRVVFTGSFLEYFIMSLGLMILSFITFGILLPYWVYWQIKYFFTKMELSNSISNVQQASSYNQQVSQTSSKKQNVDDLFD